MPNDRPAPLTRRALIESGALMAVASSLGARAALAQTDSPARDASGNGNTPSPSPSSLSTDASQAVWQSFLAALAPLARHVDEARAGGDAATLAEGVRCLTRLLALGLDRFVEFADPRHPAFYDLQTPTRKYLGDNPDQTYRTAAIDGRGHYRITGTLAGSVGVEVGVYAGDFRSDEKQAATRRRLVTMCDERTLIAGADGQFTLIVGPDALDEKAVEPSTSAPAPATAPPRIHALRSASDASSLLIRTYFHDRELRERHPMPTIERLDEPAPPAPLDLASLTRGLLATAAFVDGSLEFWNRFEGTQTRPNTLIPMPDDGTIQAARQVRYLNGRIELAPDDALLLEMKPASEPGYWSWVLQNIWGESFDWRHHPIVLNNREVRRDRKGRIRIAVAHRRPADRELDWLDLAGHRRALLSLRWRSEEPLPSVRTRVVPLDSLA